MRDPVLADKRVRHAIGYAIDREAIVDYLRRGLAQPAVRRAAAASRGPSSRTSASSPRPGAREGAARRGRLSRSRRRRPAAAPAPVAEDRRPTSTSGCRRPSSSRTCAQVGIDLDVRSYEFATFFADVLKGNFQMFTLQWVGVTDPDILRRVFHSQQVPPVGFNRGLLQQSGGRSADRSGQRGADRRGAAEVLQRGAEDDRRGRAVHQPLEQDERGRDAAGHHRPAPRSARRTCCR